MEPPEWVRDLSHERELTPAVVEKILKTHGDRGKRAIEGVAERRVKKYRDFTVVVGRHDEYIVEGDTCTCEDVRYNLPEEDPSALCWHQIAVLIAKELGYVDAYDVWYSDVSELL